MSRKSKKMTPAENRRLDLGSGKIYEKIEALIKESKNPNISLARKKTIVKTQKSLLKEWERIRKALAKLGKNIGHLPR